MVASYNSLKSDFDTLEAKYNGLKGTPIFKPTGIIKNFPSEAKQLEMTFSPKSSGKKKKSHKKDTEVERLSSDVAQLEVRVARQSEDLQKAEQENMRLSETNARLSEKVAVAEETVSAKNEELSNMRSRSLEGHSKAPKKEGLEFEMTQMAAVRTTNERLTEENTTLRKDLANAVKEKEQAASSMVNAS